MATLIRNIKTNIEAMVPDHYLDHPILGADIVPVLEDAPVVQKKDAPTLNNKKQLKVEEPTAEITTE